MVSFTQYSQFPDSTIGGEIAGQVKPIPWFVLGQVLAFGACMYALSLTRDDVGAQLLPDVSSQIYHYTAARFFTAFILNIQGMFFATSSTRRILSLLPIFISAIAAAATFSHAVGFGPRLIGFGGRLVLPAHALV
jgi:hypothetical protein